MAAGGEGAAEGGREADTDSGRGLDRKLKLDRGNTFKATSMVSLPAIDLQRRLALPLHT